MFTRKRKTTRVIREKSQEVAVLDGKPVPYTLIRTSRARRLSLKIGERSGLEVIVPRRLALSSVPRFLKEKEEWILKHLEEIELQAADKPKIEDGSIITVLGQTRTLRLFPTRKPRPHIKEFSLKRDILIEGQFAAAQQRRPEGSCSGHPQGRVNSWPETKYPREIFIYANTFADARAALEKHLRKQAAQHFKDRTAQLAEHMNNGRLEAPITYNRITIKGQKTRWGSCSREKNLNFNWRLVFASPPIIDSIIIHELAHTVHLNHGKRFYALVEQHCPNHRQLSRQLKTLSATFPL